MTHSAQGEASALPAGAPLYVALEGALVPTRLSLEALFSLLRARPHLLLLLPVWALAGPRGFREQVRRRVTLQPEALPYHQSLLHTLREERARGRAIYLCHASDPDLAARVARHLGAFDGVVAADAPPADALPGAVYAARGGGGAERAWALAAGTVAVNPGAAVARRLRGLGKPTLLLDDRPPWPHVLARALRLHQWAKNGLLLAPLIASHQVFDVRLWVPGAWAFLAFSLCASATYLLNDLLDLSADRADGSKRRRPLAAGHLGLGQGLWLLLFVFVAGLACAWPLGPAFWGVLGSYLVLTVLYSLLLKRIVLLDVVVLATLYALRVVAGNVAFAIERSEWLLALCVFLFLSLALMKRYVELISLRDSGRETLERRGYVVDDLELLGTLGTTSGYISVLVFALYITSDRVRVLYRHPDLLWPVILVMLYWVSRTWLIARRGRMSADPVVFALTDKVSYIVGVLILAIIAVASGARF